jgi:hypothetical protein
MRAHHFIVAAIPISLCLVSISAEAATATLVVPGTSNIFRAPGASVGNGIDPPRFDFTAGPDQVLTFESVTGTTGCCGPASIRIGPDGGFGATNGVTDVEGARGIAGGLLNQQMFLSGVFLDSTDLPTTGSRQTDFRNTRQQPSYSPALNRSFFIGDGFSNAGVQQQFFVPAQADMLVFGFLDAFGFVGEPGTYDDNIGALTATFGISSTIDPGTAAVPLPATLPLLLAGLGFGWLRQRRST